MGISHRKKFIYLIVPKTGSATVRNLIDVYRDIKRPTTHFSEHIPIHRFMQGEYSQIFDSYFKFSFVRNPYDRLYSGYLQDRKAAFEQATWKDSKGPIFDRIGNDFNRYIEEFVASADIWNDPWWICFCPMHAFTHVNGQKAVDWIGKTESLEADLRSLALELDLIIGKTKNLNVVTPPSSGLKYISHYRKNTIEIINEIYRNDFELFNYEMLAPEDFPQ